jgi:16S rRNA (guanine966-N2)-methyltransferase
MLGPELAGATVVDLFAGSGALGLEALSRGAAHATFVERSRRAIQCIRENIQALGAGDAAEVIERDVFSYLNGLGADAFDIAVADPPYGRGLAGRLLERYMQVPFARLLSIEHEPGEPLNSPAIARERRYGDTVITFIAAADMEEEGR